MTMYSKHSCSVFVFRRFYDSWNHLTKTDSIRESQTDRVDINTSLLHLCQKIHKKVSLSRNTTETVNKAKSVHTH